MRRSLSFWADETGAITVDWVALASAVTGLAMATAAVLNATTFRLGGDVDAELGGERVEATGGNGEPVVVAHQDFTTPADNWAGARYEQRDDGFGGILGRMTGSDGEEIVRSTFALDEHRDYAVVNFDFLAIDSWDMEDFNIYVDSTLIAVQTVEWRDDNIDRFWQASVDGVTAMVQVGNREHLGANRRFTDQVFNVTVIVENPGDAVTIGFGSTTNQGRNNESWGLDNFSLVSTDTP